jgi:hypothetical protein
MIDPIMRWAFHVAVVLGGILVLAIPIAIAAIPSSLEKFRFTELPPLPPTWTNASAFPSDQAICTIRYHGLSIFDAIGLAFGSYDVQRNQAVFDRQLEYFFGRNAEQVIHYEIEELEQDVPLLIYKVSGVTVFAFRGLVPGPELALQLEIFSNITESNFCWI